MPTGKQKGRRAAAGRAAAALMAAVLAVGMLPVSAQNATSYTYTISSDSDWVRTQDAYLTGNILLKDQQLNQPSGLFIQGGKLYVADTGNGRIVVYDLKTGACSSVGQGVLNSPTGVYVMADGTLYVADNGANAVFKMSPEGKVLKTYGRPKTATFGQQTQYSPYKVAVNRYGILYIVSQGSYDGMIQLNQAGDFLGYFGYNNNPMTVTDYLEDRFFTQAQKSQLFNRVPYSFESLAMDSKGIVYTVTQSAKGNALKKHDLSGTDLFPSDMNDETNFVDVALGPDGQIYTVTETGLLFEYDADGNLLFSLGGLAASTERAGLFTRVSAAAADGRGRIYVLDQERGFVQTFCPTEYADAVHTAMRDYNNGLYAQSEREWEQISQVSGSLQFVENGIADSLFQQQEYGAAAVHYKAAENRKGYSDAYWQIRNEATAKALPWVTAGVIALLLWVFIRKRLRGKTPEAAGPVPPYAEDFLLVGRVLKHPIDSFYDIRREGKGHVGTATLLYLSTYLVFVCNFILRGFVVSFNTPQNTSPLYVTLLYFAPVALFIGCNFFVGEINESEGRLRDVYVATAYVFAPFLTVTPFLIVLSHFMTLNESRILNLATFAVYAWVFVLLIISIKEIHAYELRGVFKNLLLTAFFMAVVILAVSLVGMFWDQLIKFVTAVLKEVKYRVS